VKVSVFELWLCVRIEVLALVSGHGEVTISADDFEFSEELATNKLVSELLLIRRHEAIRDLIIVGIAIRIRIRIGACGHKCGRGELEVEDLGRASVDCRPVAIPFSGCGT